MKRMRDDAAISGALNGDANMHESGETGESPIVTTGYPLRFMHL